MSMTSYSVLTWFRRNTELDRGFRFLWTVTDDLPDHNISTKRTSI